jgi:hypothetical protein
MRGGPMREAKYTSPVMEMIGALVNCTIRCQVF